MSSIGTGYDLAASTFSPDGRIFQIEYAQKAVDSSGTCIALRGNNGVVIAVEKLISSKLIQSTANQRILNADSHIGFAAAGIYPDAKALLRRAQEDASDYYLQYRAKVPPRFLAEQLAQYIHVYTLGILRPFGCCSFLCSWDAQYGPQLFMVDPAGLVYGYHGWAVGKHRQAAKTEIEKLNLKDMGTEELTKEAARIILSVRDETKDKNFKLEMGWVGENTEDRFQSLPPDTLAAAEAWAKSKLEEDDSDEEGMKS